jgi:short-subunit dehydrogenase
VQLDDKVVLVTGASAGIGRAIASRAGAAGARVLVHGRDDDRTRQVAAEVGGFPLVADLSVGTERMRLCAEAVETFGRVDVLVNNAGVGWAGPLTDMTTAQLRAVIKVDLLAALELTHELLPPMVTRGEGAICFVSSIAGRTGVAGEAVYSAAKAGIDMFAESLRAETSATGVGVSVVVPGAVSTGFFDNRGLPYTRARPRPVPPEAVAKAVLDAVTRGRAEAWVPRWLRIAPVVRAVAPGPYRLLSTRFGEQVRVTPEPNETPPEGAS